VAKPHKAIAD